MAYKKEGLGWRRRNMLPVESLEKSDIVDGVPMNMHECGNLLVLHLNLNWMASLPITSY